MVPIQKQLGSEGWDYAAWISLADGNDVKMTELLTANSDEKHSNLFLLYLDQENAPDWYENHLLSTTSFNWRGNVLLAYRDGMWPSNLTMDYSDVNQVTRSLAKALVTEEGVRRVNY